MPKVAQTLLATKGILLLRGWMQNAPDLFDADRKEAFNALCDYTEKTIAARANGGSKTEPKIARANGRKGGRPRLPENEIMPAAIARRKRRGRD